MLHAVSLAGVLAVLWWLLSGFTLPLILALGAASVVAVVIISAKMDAVDRESHPIYLHSPAIIFYPWLFWEITKSNIDVAIAILRGDRAIEPRVFTVTATQRSEVGRVTYANSITLTPGTVTLDVDGDQFTVHALTRAGREGVLSGEMDRRISALRLGSGGPSADEQPALQDEENLRAADRGDGP